MKYRSDFKQAADLVRAILHGGWTFDTPAWAGPTMQPLDMDEPNIDPAEGGCMDEFTYTRAVWTAEAFIIYFEVTSLAFRPEKFLIECGLKEKPARRKGERHAARA